MKIVINIILVLVVGVAATAMLSTVIYIFGLIDFSLLYYVSNLFNYIAVDFTVLFNYPNVWLLVSYFLGKGLLFYGLKLIL